jgi:hypothetical protein
MIEQHESFWTTVYPLFMDREITRSNVREVIRRGLEEARGNYKIVARLFNMETRDYKRFLNFLRKHDCQIPFKEYASGLPRAAPTATRRPRGSAPGILPRLPWPHFGPIGYAPHLTDL